MSSATSNSQSFEDEVLQTLIKSESGEAATQMGFKLLREQSEEGFNYLEQAENMGEPWAVLFSEYVAIDTDDDLKKHADRLDEVTSILTACFEKPCSRLFKVRACEVLKKLLDKYPGDADFVPLLNTAIKCGWLNVFDGFDCDKQLLNMAVAKYKSAGKGIPQNFLFLRKYGLDDLSISMVKHELGVAYEFGVKGLIKRDRDLACRLYAEALAAYFGIENSPRLLQEEHQDEEYLDQDEQDHFVLLNSLCRIVMEGERDLLLKDAETNARYISARLGRSIIEESGKGRNHNRRLQERLQLLESLAEGNPYCADLLIRLLKQGTLLKKDEAAITKLLKYICRFDKWDKYQIELADRLEAGIGIMADKTGAEKCRLKAAEHWVDEAMARLAEKYCSRASSGDQDAILRYGHCLEHGLGVKQDHDTAKLFYNRISLQPLRYARLCGLYRREGNLSEAERMLELGKKSVTEHKTDWKAYFAALDLELGVTKKQNPGKAKEKFLELYDTDVDFDLPDRVNRCAPPDDGSGAADPLSAEWLEAEERKCQAWLKAEGDDRDWVDALTEYFEDEDRHKYLTETVTHPEPKKMKASDLQALALDLKRILPKLRQYVLDTEFSFDPENGSANSQFFSAFSTGTVIELPTYVCVTANKGGLGKNKNLRFLILSNGLIELKNGRYASLKAAMIPAGDRLLVMDTYSAAGKYLVVMLHDPGEGVMNCKWDELYAADDGLSEIRKEFCKSIKKPPIPNSDNEEWEETVRHASLDSVWSGDLASYFAKKA